MWGIPAAVGSIGGVAAIACVTLRGGGHLAIDAASATAWAGRWAGVASCGAQSADVFLDVAKPAAPGAAVTAVFHLPITNIRNLPLGPLAFDAEAREFTASGFRFTAEGSGDEATRIDGRFQAGDQEITMSFERTAKAPPADAPHPESPVAKPEWTFRAGSPIWAPCAIANELVVFGDVDGVVHALCREEGVERWRVATDGAIFARPTIALGMAYVPSDDGTLHAIDVESGVVVWTAEIGSSVIARRMPSLQSSRYDSFGSSPALDDGVLYVGGSNGALHAIDAATGKERWKFVTGDLVRSSPACADGRVFFGSYDGTIYALRTEDGSLAWKRKTGGEVVSSPAVRDGVVYIGSRDSSLYALVAATGDLHWRRFGWLSWVESSAVLAGDMLYVGSSDDQRLFALDVATGESRWTFDTDGSAWSSPAVAADLVFIGAVGTTGYMADHRGGFYAVDRASGVEAWHVPFPASEGSFLCGVVASPVVNEGRVYVGALDGVFRAFACEGSSPRADPR